LPFILDRDSILEPMLLPILIAAVFGLAFGSFLNVCISRLPAGASIAHPRSQCPHCHHAIAAYDNIPLLSWLLLRRRCRHCQRPIPARYPLVELATAAWFAASVACFSLSLAAVNAALLGFLLIGLLVMDWQTQLLPDEFTLGGALAGYLLCAVRAFLLPMDRGQVVLTAPERILLYRLLAILAATLILLAVRILYRRLRHTEGMGLGDVKMLAMIAAFLDLRHAVLALFIGVLAGALYAVALLAMRRARAGTRIPFGSFLALGGLASALVGTPIIVWYTTFFR
jgi:leader peptidase (prepilin peptidase)/N-methyltransferase